MKIRSFQLNTFKAPGKLMFGATPDEKWAQLYPANEEGQCNWALRSLLIENEGELILIDSGFGVSNTKVLEEYCVDQFKPANEILKMQGVNPSGISYVVHTHLHIDHCGGSFIKNFNGKYEASFPYSKYVVSTAQLLVSESPTDFERDSFDEGVVSSFSGYPGLVRIEKEKFLFNWFELLIFNGHTSGLLVPVIHAGSKTIVFCGDLISSAAHIILQSASAYDVNPILTLAEREIFLEEAFENNYYLFFQHDLNIECCSLKKENSRIVPAAYYKVEELFD
jgi:glyoxylase-like metal-dependent hydrolase (beta-lactamase superfamily II)